MKNIFWKILLAVALLAANACNLLDQKSPNEIESGDVFTTPTGAENALIGLYSTLQNRAYLGGDFVLLPEAYAGLATTGGYDVASLDEAGAGQMTSQNLYCEATYVAIYRVVANANNLLAGLENIPDEQFAEGRKARIAAEARFIRAMAHFDLLRWFGYYWDKGATHGIPVVDHATAFDEIVPRNTVDASYKFIINELSGIRDEFPDDETRQANYINRSTVEALLARVCVHSRDYDAAYGLTSSVISNPAYALLDGANIGKIYTDRGTSEGIFELAFDIRTPSGFNGLTYLKDNALRPELSFLAAQSLQDFFQNRPDDARAGLLNFDSDANDITIQPDGRTEKYRGETTRDNPAFVLRLAEMYLLRSEALFQQGLDGWKDLNALRTARGLEEIVPADPLSPDEYWPALLDEYRAEFNFEGQYLYAAVRSGRAEQVLGLEPFRWAFPIPNREVAASSGAVSQNPGY